MNKKLLVAMSVGLLFAIGLMAKVPAKVATAAPAESHAVVVMGGGTAVLFDNGDLYDLVGTGWRKTGHLPDGLSIKNVKIVLNTFRIVEADGTGWIFADGAWKSVPPPVHQ